MPKGTKVHRLYEKLKGEGKSVKSAVRIAQAATGQALATGKKPKRSKESDHMKHMRNQGLYK